MRRGDATTKCAHSVRRRAAALLASTLVHAAALAMAGAAVVAAPHYPRLIPIRLLAGGNGGAAGSVPGSSGSPPAAEPALTAARRIAKPAAQPLRRHVASRKMTRRARPVWLESHSTKPAAAVSEGNSTGDHASVAGDGAVGPGGGTSGYGSGGGDGVDARALCVYCPTPAYPFTARLRGWEGNVDVGLVLGADGRVYEARVQRSSGHRVLDDVALAVARRSRFTVAHADGEPLRGRMEYRFRVTDSQ
jgi:periplasmic protein TonB